MRLRQIWLLVLLVALPNSLFAAVREDVVGVTARPVELRVIDEKCLNCHNRQRIDEAVRQRKNVQEILKKMEQKGVSVSDKEREVLGHFWRQNPLKSNK